MSATPAHMIEVDSGVFKRLSRHVRADPGRTLSAVTSRFLEEALRMEEHPGVFFNDGPTGRRAVLLGGPDVWEIARAVKLLREAEPDLDAKAIVAEVGESTGLGEYKVRIALRYWAAYTDEIDQEIIDADEAEHDAKEQWQREQRLLS